MSCETSAYIVKSSRLIPMSEPSGKFHRSHPSSSRRRRTRRASHATGALGLVGLFGCVGCLGCGGQDGEESLDDAVNVAPEGDAPRPLIYGGTQDDDERALSGVVALRVGTGSTFELCSGSLIAPNVVLTARHCVTQNVTSSVSCDQNGRSANGKHVATDEDPTIIGVYTGPRPNFARKPEARAKAIVGPKGDFLCNSDIALVVLEQGIETATPLAVRLQGPARVGELVRSVGYGQNDQEEPIGTRFRREDVRVLAQGRTVSASKTPLGAREFEVGQSICQGDSGGPAISQETHAVIGVVSRGGTCDEDHGHIYTTAAGFDDLFDEAFAIAGTSPILETRSSNPDALGPDPNSVRGTDERPPKCSTSAGPPRAGLAAEAGLLVAAALVARRRGVSERRPSARHARRPRRAGR